MANLALLPIIGSLFGAFAGWFVGLFFDQTILTIASHIGFPEMDMWQFGCFLGFVGGFLKTKVSAEVKNKD